MTYIATYIVSTDEDYAIDKEIGVIGVYNTREEAVEEAEKLYNDFYAFRNIYKKYKDLVDEKMFATRFIDFEEDVVFNQFINSLDDYKRKIFSKYIKLFMDRDSISYRITKVGDEPKPIECFIYYE